MVTLQSLSIGYEQNHSQKVVAQHMDATVNDGELTCLIGPNGVGKSTLLRTLAAFQKPLAGQVLLNGTPLSQLSHRQLARSIGVVLTGRPGVLNMTVHEMVAMGRSPYTGFWGGLSETDRQIVDESIGLVGLTPLAERLVGTLSDGETQKMMIAKALAQQTPVICLDEPTAFLDYPSKVEMLQLLRRLARQTGKTIFLSTHDLELALQMADRIWLMQPGQPLAVGTPRQLADDGTMGRFLDRPGLHFDPSSLTIRIL